tara:strand:- start:240 stop:593 length:354 start_codon:yes stop_codon:yes gene_type:complete
MITKRRIDRELGSKTLVEAAKMLSEKLGSGTPILVVRKYADRWNNTKGQEIPESWTDPYVTIDSDNSPMFRDDSDPLFPVTRVRVGYGVCSGKIHVSKSRCSSLPWGSDLQPLPSYV